MRDELIVRVDFFMMLVTVGEKVCGLCPSLNTHHVNAIMFGILKIMLIQVFLGFLSLHLLLEMKRALLLMTRCWLFGFEFGFFRF